MTRMPATSLWPLSISALVLLAGCGEEGQSPPSRPEPPAEQDTPGGSMLAPLDLVYVCGNKFLATNGTHSPVQATYRVVGTGESGALTLDQAPLEDPAHSELELETTEQGTVEALPGRGAGGPAPERRPVLRRERHLAERSRGRRSGLGRVLVRPVSVAGGGPAPEPAAGRPGAELGACGHAAGLESGHRRIPQRAEPLAALLRRPCLPAGRPAARGRRTHHRRPRAARYQSVLPGLHRLDRVHADAPGPLVSHQHHARLGRRGDPGGPG